MPTTAGGSATLALGANITNVLTADSTHAFERLAVWARLVTNATVGTRIVNVQEHDAAFLLSWYQAGIATPVASTTTDFAFSGSSGPGSAGNTYNDAIPPLLAPSNVIQLLVTGAKAGDTLVWNAIYCSNLLSEAAHVDVASSVTLPVTISGTLPTHEQGTATIAGAITCSSGCTGGAGGGSCPFDSTTTTTSSTTTTAPPVTEADQTGPCKVALASFTGNGLSVPVALGLLVFCAAFGIVMLMRRGSA